MVFTGNSDPVTRSCTRSGNTVEKGTGLLLSEPRTTVGDLEIASSHPFPEIGAMGKPVQDLGHDIPEMIVEGRHPIVNGLAEGTRFPVSVFTHQRSQSYLLRWQHVQPGPPGHVLVRNAFGDPVVVAGEIGKGRVVFLGFGYGREMVTSSVDHLIYESALRWLVGLV